MNARGPINALGPINARGENRRCRSRPRAATPSLAALAGGLALSVLGSGLASAQFFDDREMLMPPRAVVWRLNDRGFRAVTRPEFDGRAYVVEADDPYGERVRMFVDARDGAILRRQRLDAGPPPVRVARPAPGYGWTEEEPVPRRPIREAARIAPPGDGPGVGRRMAPAAPPPARAEAPDRNPMGLNPDARPASEAPAKVVRLAPATKPAAPRVSPQAPRLSETPPAVPEAKPAAALDAPKPVTPATNASPPAPPPREAKAAKDWKDPPADQKRPVRVIGGATVVPGATPQAEPAKD
ncbi:MAG: hypothetical protein Q7T93_15655 [Methylobacterium sp.]|uniref:hypothetical protein n=1 Tax=Methylobacterium sp. TaxID=409 RepID=UPI00272322D5|nr:hypothetical protein [Methylobacterium sp.]MDO9428251.1 hypothetical protein [Methylobacterium sp.]